MKRSAAASLVMLLACSEGTRDPVGPTWQNAAPQPWPPLTASAPLPPASASAGPEVDPVPQVAEPTKPRPLARGDGSKQDASLAEGDKLYLSGDFAGAEAAYKKASQAAPKDPAGVVGFVRARLAKEDIPTDFGGAAQSPTLKGMIQQLRSAVKLDDKYAPVHLELGRALLVLGKADDAHASLKKAVELDATDPEAFSALGVCQLAKGDKEGAVKSLTKAAELEPRSPPRLSNLGTAQMLVGRVAEAIATYQKALQLAPNDPGTLNDLGSALLFEARFDDAITQLEKARKLAPKNAAVLQNLGYAHDQKGQRDKAQAFYEEALKIDDKLVSAWINLGNLHAKRDKLPEAKAAIEKARAIDPEDPRVKAALAELAELEKSRTAPK